MSGPSDPATQSGPEARLRTLAEAAREDLRRAAAAGDREARRILLDLGELAPAPRHWADLDDPSDTDSEKA